MGLLEGVELVLGLIIMVGDSETGFVWHYLCC